MGDKMRPPTARVEFDASAAPHVSPEQMREHALHTTREWLETVALGGRTVQAEDVLLFAEAYASSQVVPEKPAPAQRPAADVFAMVRDELPVNTDPGVVEGLLKRLVREGMLTPGDVVLRDARQLGLGVLVDGKPVEPDRVHLVKPRAGETRESIRERLRDAVRERAPELAVDGPIIGPMLDSFSTQLAELYEALPAREAYVRCERCGTAFSIETTAADEPCARCGAYALVAVREVTRETPEPVCPNCGANRQDYCDSPEGNSTPDCGSCGTAMPPSWRAGEDVYPNDEYDDAVAALRGCKGCGRPIGRAHTPECGFARSRIVNPMQTRIAPVMTDDERRAAAAGGSRAGAREAAADRLPVGTEPDLVSRMIDARTCLHGVRGRNEVAMRSGVEGALRWLDLGVEEGLAQRELIAGLRLLLAGAPHVCTCGHSPGCEGCSPGFEDRCRFEKSLRSLLGVEDGTAEEPVPVAGEPSRVLVREARAALSEALTLGAAAPASVVLDRVRDARDLLSRALDE